jgi:HlyD family secretion protein
MTIKKTGLSTLILIIAAALFLLVVRQIFLSGEEYEGGILTARVIKTDMTVEVLCVGELDAAESVVLSSSVRGDRGKIIELVEDGKHVEAGEVLVRLDPTAFQEEVLKLGSKATELASQVEAQKQMLEWEKNQAERENNRAESDLHVARLELRRLEQGEGPKELARLDVEARKAKEEFDKKQGYRASLEELVQKGYSSPTEEAQIKSQIEEARQAYEMVNMQLASYRDHLLPVQVEKAKAAITAAEVALEQTRKGGGYKVGQAVAALTKAEQELVSARQNLTRAEDELNATVIRAPGPGMVVLAEQNRGSTFRKPRVGDQVWQSQPIVYLPDISRMIVETRVREVDLHKIDIGKPVTARADAYPELLLKGRVESIGILADRGREDQKKGRHFRVIIRLEESNPRLRPGMTARVNILCSQASGVLAVPAFAVFRDNGNPFVYVARGGGFDKREVKTGAQSEDLVEITAGLKKGERVALSRPESFQVRNP